MIKKYKIKRNDKLRALLTDVLPFETPLIFSNVGFYNCVTRLSKVSDTNLSSDFFKVLGFEDPAFFLGNLTTINPLKTF